MTNENETWEHVRKLDITWMKISVTNRLICLSLNFSKCQPNNIADSLPWSLDGSLMALAMLVAHDGRLAARSLQSERFRSKLSNVEKLLRDDSQLKFWLKLFDGKLVTTPLDELLLAYELSRWIDGGTDGWMTSSISPWSVSQPSSVLELHCCIICECRSIWNVFGSPSAAGVKPLYGCTLARLSLDWGDSFAGVSL